MKKSIKAIFSVGPDDFELEVGDQTHPFVIAPKWGDKYKHRLELLSPVANWIVNPKGDSLALVGDSGAGKSSLLVDICYRLGIPSLHVTAHERMTVQEMIGHHTVIDGAMFYVHGPLAIAMRDGFLFVINEFDLMDPGELAGLNDILEGSPLMIPENGGEVINGHENFRLAVTGNTNGCGDDSGNYVGTGLMNFAFMDRFRTIEVTYLSETDEHELLQSYMTDKDKGQLIPSSVLSSMVKVATLIRTGFKKEGEGALDAVLSTRTLMRWAWLTYQNKQKAREGESPVKFALKIALTNRVRPETREAIDEIVTHVFGTD